MVEDVGCFLEESVVVAIAINRGCLNYNSFLELEIMTQGVMDVREEFVVHITFNF
jgi:hypothetical protein